MSNTPITRGELAELIEQQAGQLAAALRGDAGTTHPLEQETTAPATSAATPTTVPAAVHKSLGGERWRKVGELEGESYGWPTGTEHYSVFEVWEMVDANGRRWQLGLGQAAERGT